MKVRNLEGTPQELTDYFRDNGLNAADLFDPPKPEISIYWIVGCVILFLILIAVLVLVENMASKYRTLNLLGVLAMALTCAALVQLRFKNGYAAAIVGIGGALLALVAYGTVSPAEIADTIKAVSNKKG